MTPKKGSYARARPRTRGNAGAASRSGRAKGPGRLTRAPATAISDDFYRDIVEASPAMLFVGDVDGNGIFASRPWLEFTGWTLDNIGGNGWWGLVHPDDREHVRREFEKGRAIRAPLHIECRLRRADGEYRWILASSVARSDAAGHFLGYVGSCVDITDRIQAETALRESELRHRVVARSTYDAIWDWDMVANTVEWNDGVQSLFGYTCDQIGSDAVWWLRHIHPDDRESIARSVQQAIETTASTWAGEYRYQRADGSYARVLARGDMLRAPNGRPVRMVGAMVDVTQQRQAEDALAEHQVLLETILDQAAAAIVVCDAAGTPSFVNPAARLITGLDAAAPAAELIPPLWGTLYDAADGSLVPVESWPMLMALRDQVTLGREYRVRRPDGGAYDILISAAPMRNAKGELIGGVSTFADITEWRRAEHRTAALLAVAREISGTTEQTELLDRVQRQTTALLPCDRALTYYWDSTCDAYRLIAHRGVPADLVAEAEALLFPPGLPVVDEMLAGRPVIIGQDDRALVAPADLLAYYGLGWVAVLPLRVHGRTVGGFVVARNTGGAVFSAAELELADGFARQLAVGLETAELLQAQRVEAHAATALARVGQELISSLDTPVLLDRLCRVTAEVLECDCTHAILWREEDGAFIPVANYGDSPEQWEAIRALTLPHHMLMGDGRDVWAGVVDESMGTLGSLARQFNIAAGLRVALRRGNEVTGVLTAAYRGAARRFSPHQQRIAHGIAQLAAMALENARLVEAVQQASRLKSDFVASMSHELRTPLNVIIGYNNLLLDGEFGTLNGDQAETTQRMRRSAGELLELINTTLDLGRLEAGRLPVSVTHVRVEDLIEEINIETAGIRSKNGVVFSWQVGPSLPALQTDRLKLKVVLKNLIGNALKFTAHGHVTVEVRADRGGVEFVVRDSGIGIAAEAQSVIFEPFRQAESGIGQNYGGVGLGLYIAQRLVTLLGGTIGVDSAPGIGSTFKVAVPRSPAPAIAALS